MYLYDSQAEAPPQRENIIYNWDKTTTKQNKKLKKYKIIKFKKNNYEDLIIPSSKEEKQINWNSSISHLLTSNN